MLECGICTIAVPFFFFASGFFLAGHTCEEGWYRREVGKRVVSLLVPYFMVASAWLLFGSFLRLIAHFCFNAKLESLLCDPLLVQYGISLSECPSLHPLWYVRALFVLVLCSPLLVAVQKSRWALLCLFIVYGWICPGPTGEGFVHGLTRCGILPLAGLFYFTLGIYSRRHGMDYVYAKSVHVALLLVGLVLFALQALFASRHCLHAQHFGWLGIPFALWGAWGLIPNAKWPAGLVSNAFAVYLIHKFFYAIRGCVMGDEVSCLWKYFLFSVLMFLLSLLVANGLKKLFPRFARIAFGGR